MAGLASTTERNNATASLCNAPTHAAGHVHANRWFDSTPRNRHGACRCMPTLGRRVNGKLRRLGPKTEASARTLGLPPVLLCVLREHTMRQEQERRGEHWREHGLVFPSGVGTLMEPGNLHRAFKTILEQAGLPTTILFHGLHHSCATLLPAQGEALVVVRDILGHTDQYHSRHLRPCSPRFPQTRSRRVRCVAQRRRRQLR